jgi:hypothetical protein
MRLLTTRTVLALVAVLTGVVLTVPSVASAAETSPSGWAGSLTPNQLAASRSLTAAEAQAACGPAAAVAFARATGRSLSLDAAVAAARQVGWTPANGMSGPYGEQALLTRLNIPSVVEAGVDPAKVKRELLAGRPVIIRTAGGSSGTGHYFVAERLDSATGRYDLAQSALVLRAAGGKRWFSLNEIVSLGVGSPTHALYLASSPNITLIAASARPITAIPMTAAGGSSGSRTVSTGGSGANLRAAPGTGARIVDTLADGSRVTPTGATATVAGRLWQRVTLAGGTAGWMDASLLVS